MVLTWCSSFKITEFLHQITLVFIVFWPNKTTTETLLKENNSDNYSTLLPSSGSSSPVLMRFCSCWWRWPDSPHSWHDHLHTLSPLWSIKGILFLQTNLFYLIFYLLLLGLPRPFPPSLALNQNAFLNHFTITS